MRYSEFDSLAGKEESGIYKITNTVTGKAYIGMSKNIYHRWRDHAKARGSCRALHNSINKHGVDKFDFEVIEVCKDVTRLPSLEIQYISELNTLTPNGYNLTYGGEGVVAGDEIKKKFSKRMTDMWASEDGRKDLMEKLHSDEVRDKRTETLSVVRYTEEYREAFLAAVRSTEYKQKQGADAALRWKDEDYKARLIEKLTEAQNRPEQKQKVSESSLLCWQDEDYRERIRFTQAQSWIDTDRAERQSDRMFAVWSDPEYKSRVAAKIGAANRDPSKLKIIAAAAKKSWATPERRVKMCFNKRRTGKIPSFEEGWSLALSKGFLHEDWYSFALAYYAAKHSSNS